MGAQGTTTVDFGGTGSVEATATVTGQAAIVAGSLVEAWLFPVATASHSIDEHLVEEIDVIAHSVVAGTGFTITARLRTARGRGGEGEQIGGRGRTSLRPRARLRGQFTVGWVWN